MHPTTAAVQPRPRRSTCLERAAGISPRFELTTMRATLGSAAPARPACTSPIGFRLRRVGISLSDGVPPFRRRRSSACSVGVRRRWRRMGGHGSCGGDRALKRCPAGIPAVWVNCVRHRHRLRAGNFIPGCCNRVPNYGRCGLHCIRRCTGTLRRPDRARMTCSNGCWWW